MPAELEVNFIELCTMLFGENPVPDYPLYHIFGFIIFIVSFVILVAVFLVVFIMLFRAFRR